MKNFHRLGTIAVVTFGVVGGALAWAAFSDSVEPHARSNARLALRLLFVAGMAFWGWYLREERQRANPAHFTDNQAFAQHLDVLVTFDDDAAVASTWLAPGKVAKGVLALGERGFDARLRRIEATGDAAGMPGLRVAVQLLVPATALAQLAPGTTPRVLVDGGPVGTARVLSVVERPA